MHSYAKMSENIDFHIEMWQDAIFMQKCEKCDYSIKDAISSVKNDNFIMETFKKCDYYTKNDNFYYKNDFYI